MRTDRFKFTGISSLQDIKDVEQRGDGKGFPESTYQVIQDSCMDNADEPALSFFMLGGEYKRPFCFNYREVFEEINALANALDRLGVESGDVVGLLLPNLPETCFSMFAAQARGIVFPINPLLEHGQIKELLNAANVKVVITIGPFVKTDVWEKVDAIRLEVPTLRHVVQVKMNNYLRGIKKLIVGAIVNFKNSGSSRPTQELHDYRSLVGEAERTSLNFKRKILPDDPAAYFHTGGTTGSPKIAIQTHANICFDCWSTGHNLKTDVAELNFYGGLPLFHVFGAMVTLSLCWAGSGHLVLVSPKGFRGDGVLKHFWDTLDHYNINAMAAVPAVYKMLNDAPGALKGNQMEFAISGAAPLPVEVMKAWKRKTGIEILEGYGCTEGTCMVAVNPPYGERKLGSVGFPIPFTEVKILEDAEESREVLPGEVGLVCLSGDNVFKGYLEDQHNKNVWIQHNGKKFYNTGDLGKVDQDGYLWLTGRKKELIIRGGHNIDPMIIEEPMYEHPAVEMAAAVGRPDTRVGEVPVLYVQLKPDSKVSVKELEEFARKKIQERAAVPRHIVLIDEIPLTTIGKIFKPELCAMQIELAYMEQLKSDFPTASVAVAQSKKKGFVVTISGIPDEQQSDASALIRDFVFSTEFTA